LSDDEGDDYVDEKRREAAGEAFRGAAERHAEAVNAGEKAPAADGDGGRDLGGADDQIAAEALAGAGLLTEQQGRAWYLRDLADLTRAETADVLDVTISTVDKHTRAAREKIEVARATVDVLDQLDDRLVEDVDE
jgi:DNA-directed RNA polymerase specialized sigma24 family protein